MARSNFPNSYVIGFDPGADGGMCLLDSSGRAIIYERVHDDFMNIVRFFDVVRHAVGSSPVTCVFEEYRGDQAANAARHSGMYVGIAMTLCAVHNMKLVKISPQVWKAHFKLIIHQKKGEPKLSDTVRYKLAKERSMAKVVEIFPNVNLVFPRCTNPHEGVAESLLIAEFGRATLL